MPEIVLHIVILSFFALASAATTYFLDFCIGSPSSGEIQKGRIFGSYGKWILEGYNRREDQIQEAEKKAIQDGEAEIDELLQKSPGLKKEIRKKHLRKVRRVNYWKAAGICYVCSNAWISFLYYPAASYLAELSILQIGLFLIPFVVIANLIVRKLF